jgi:hypothetical protein
MSQRDVERTLGRQLTDAAFRRCFFQDPAQGVSRSWSPVGAPRALLRVPRRRLGNLSGKLDDRICRLHIEHSDDRRAR